MRWLDTGLVRGLLVGVPVAGVGLLALAVLARPALRYAPPTEGVGSALIPALVGTVLALVVHEGGHLVGALLAGWRPAHVRLGPLSFARPDARWQFRWEPAAIQWGGGALSVPRTVQDVARFRRQALVMLAAGPAASLLAGAGALVALVALARMGANPWVLRIAEATGLVSTVVGLAVLVPVAIAPGAQSDGAALQWFRRASREELVLRAAALCAQGVRPARWDPSLASWLGAAVRPGVAGAIAALHRAWYAADLNRWDEAQAALADARAQLAAHADDPEAAAIRQPLAEAEALLCAVARRDAAGARRWLHRPDPDGDAIGDPTGDPSVAALVGAALARLEGATATARAEFARAQALRGRGATPFAGDRHAWAFEALARDLAGAGR